ncbi:MAG: hypothetical protein Q4B73_07620 [Lachnospiraceae bacterium]|nr:hypothetical protein [Lachnospiraceae bacterium]
MKCMNCGEELVNSSVYCPVCGCDLSVQKQAIVLSGLYYNQGLEKAGIRDLSGAIDQLKRSLKFNKLNIPARNLLGLVYFETGEVVAALSEWVISKNIQPDDNIASEYIDALRRDANRLNTINQTIKKYNIALENCGNGNEDMAEIQLKKILAQNSKLIKGYHLLALLYIRKEEYEKARKLLKKAARIDRTNTTTLRFLREVDEQTGTPTSLEPRFSFWTNREKRHLANQLTDADDMTATRTVLSPAALRARSGGIVLWNIILGIVIGVACVIFLVMPARIGSINKAANEKVAQYSSRLADKSAELEKLQNDVAAAEASKENAHNETSNATASLMAYQHLLNALYAIDSQNYAAAAAEITEVDAAALADEAKPIYDYVFLQSGTMLLAQYKATGIEAFNQKDYANAIDQLEKAKAVDSSDYDVLNYLAHAYRLSGNTQAADANFQYIIDLYPDTTRAENARLYMSNQAGAPAAEAPAPAPEPAAPEEGGAPEGGEQPETPEVPEEAAQ